MWFSNGDTVLIHERQQPRKRQYRIQVTAAVQRRCGYVSDEVYGQTEPTPARAWFFGPSALPEGKGQQARGVASPLERNWHNWD